MGDHLLLTLLFVAVIFACAAGVSSLLIRFVPAVARELQVDQTQRQLTIDGLRGILALGVVCHHLLATQKYLVTGEWGVPNTNFGTQIGQGGVALFFMITAFLFWGRLLDVGPRMQWKKFFVARFFRLTPLYWVMVTFLTLLVLAGTGWRLQVPTADFCRDIGEWLGFTLRSAPNINAKPMTGMIILGVTWSLRYEWVFYFGLPLFALVFTKARHLGAAVVSAGLLIGFWYLTRFNPLLGRMFAPFLGGILVAYGTRMERLRALGRGALFGGFALLCLGVVAFLRNRSNNPVSLALLTVFFAAVACDNVMLGWIRAATMRWLGEVSYGIYLLHGVVVWIGLRVLFPRWFDVSALSNFGFVALSAVLIVPLVLGTSLLNLWVERPGIALGRRVAGWTPGKESGPSSRSIVPESKRVQ